MGIGAGAPRGRGDGNGAGRDVCRRGTSEMDTEYRRNCVSRRRVSSTYQAAFWLFCFPPVTGIAHYSRLLTHVGTTNPIYEPVLIVLVLLSIWYRY